MSSSAPTLSHLDEAGQVRMVDVIGKADSERVAVAAASVRLNAVAYGLLTAPGQGRAKSSTPRAWPPSWPPSAAPS